MNIGIIGGGSTGLLLGSHLAVKHNVTIYVRREQQKKTLNENGIFSPESNKSIIVKSLLISEMHREDYLFVCVKQHHVSQVIPFINQTNIESTVIFLQNGMGHINLLQKLTQTVLVGVVEHGALRKNDHIVSHTGKGVIKLAVFSGDRDDLDPIVNNLHQHQFPFRGSSDWESLLQGKLIINAVINPLTSLFNLKNGDIFKNVYIHNIACELCREASLVLGLDFNQQLERVQEVADKTGNNISSMLKDLQENRKTEIEAICGYLINQSNHPIPYTTFIYTSIKAMEKQKEIKE
ncbi:2-dehydropantoate 2-reductase [Virgibacillus salinus]|uniref:2-dehydropantoate 2-reductase n=1 Tax=Virgibacillus salinus TaxID=553311 RepID=A0A1H1CGE6_9BACI|nr:2-dehydropantoate 2-reductase [Virgibacillus salinus]SDQ63208.1 2-dehydropantoate 2-reductase [Virgibacillus salinus]